jgi:hypothetical protein
MKIKREDIEVIKEFIKEEECGFDFNCMHCVESNECHMEAIARSNEEYAESINYGGYSNAEEFYDNI